MGLPLRFLATLRARGPCPLLAISGEQGSAKTVLSKMLKALIDTSAAPVRALPREERERYCRNNGYLLAFDKLSGLPAWLSDTLCRLASGGSFAVRQLYTEGDEVDRLAAFTYGNMAASPLCKTFPAAKHRTCFQQAHPHVCAADGSTQTLPDRRGAGRSRCSTRERHARYVEHQKNWQNNLETMDAAVHAGNNCRRSGE